MTQETKVIPLGGGLDLVSPPLKVAPGRLKTSGNYEPVLDGYRRINGIERFDGHPKPSEASYWVLDFTAGDSEPLVDHLVIGVTSGATAEMLAVAVESGSWAGNDAAGYLVLTNVSGEFEDGESIAYLEPVAFTTGFSGGFH